MKDAIRFTKVESLQNDFLVVAGDDKVRRWTGRRVRAICHRRRGVGADGVILLGPLQANGARFRLINADGSRAEWSGNGGRCAALCLSERYQSRREFTIVTAAGAVTLVVRSRRRGRANVTFTRPLPEVQKLGTARLKLPRVAGRPWSVDAGNPHWVFVVRNFDFPWEELAARCQSAARASGGVNVEYVRVVHRGRIEMRLYERGVGPTPSSGSGALAAIAVCLAEGLIETRVQAVAPGGVQRAFCDRNRKTVRLSAPTRIVSEGLWRGVHDG